MPALKFTFSIEKLVHALAFFSSAGVPDLTKLKAAKLLFFADKKHLLAFGRPILGDVYYCLPYGPIPSVALNEMNDAISSPEVDEQQSDKSFFTQILKVHKPIFGGHHVFQARDGFDREVFSESELKVLAETANEFGQYSAGRLVELSHRDPTWVTPNKERADGGRRLIPYELFFADASEEARQMLDVLHAEQEEDREFNELLCHSGVKQLV